MIDKHELEIFIKRILTNGTSEKAKHSLEQLKVIIIMQALSIKDYENIERQYADATVIDRYVIDPQLSRVEFIIRTPAPFLQKNTLGTL